MSLYVTGLDSAFPIERKGGYKTLKRKYIKIYANVKLNWEMGLLNEEAEFHTWGKKEGGCRLVVLETAWS